MRVVPESKDGSGPRVRPGPTVAFGAARATVAAVVIAALALIGVAPLSSQRSAAGVAPRSAGDSGLRAVVPTPRIAPSPRSAGQAATQSPAPRRAPACAVTKPDPPFVPPTPDLGTPPASYEGAWYGTRHLWTMLHDGGEVWGPWVRLDAGLPQKTFWWSVDWVPQDEPEPSITVTGQRLDAAGSFRFGDPGTNATADFGTAMLVGIDIPTYGCWRVTARYRAATLSYVVSVVDH